MVDFLTKPFQKMQKNTRAKGVALKSPDIKIIMYVCTPLNKVFVFQGSKILVVNLIVNTKVPRKFTVCIRFQLGNSFGNT